ncbi:MAG: integration host factor subunit beta [Tepidimonas sp.]|uniref:integration host factor subunit beta n=1 Tax=Tepidimonas sp. TaxID=2002775 RepID=UPI00298F22D6|nr:integration host factor subunit beta [Tepidimonas sp.]MCS6810985.1 integration host factor subunit beta [Tepidimonas sp.]MDW8337312.1 integration host factor subunit beta [Tepidimonas sp.]
MNRSDLFDALAERYPHLTATDAQVTVKTILETMAQALAAGQRIEVRGFGSFAVHQRQPRQARNPRTGEAVTVPERRVVHFKPGKALRDAVDAASDPT